MLFIKTIRLTQFIVIGQFLSHFNRDLDITLSFNSRSTAKEATRLIGVVHLSQPETRRFDIFGLFGLCILLVGGGLPFGKNFVVEKG